MSYYSVDWHPLIVAAPYVGAGAFVISVEFAVRSVRRWCNSLPPDRVPSPVKAPARIVSRPYDWSLEDARGVALASVHHALETHSARLPELFSPMSKTDRRVQAELWPHVIPLREVAGHTNKTRPGRRTPGA